MAVSLAAGPTRLRKRRGRGALTAGLLATTLATAGPAATGLAAAAPWAPPRLRSAVQRRAAAGRRGGLLGAALGAALILAPGAGDALEEVGVSGSEPLYLSSRPTAGTYFRYDADGNLADVVKADLASRVVRPPTRPSSCYGAEDGDLVSIRFTAAYELPGMNGIEASEEESLDLLINPKAGGDRWQVYDSSNKRGGVFRVPLGDKNVISGVDIGLHGMCEGERRVLYIPAALAYADRGNKAFGVPPDVRLRWDVELQGTLPMGRRGARGAKPSGSRRVPGRLLE